MKETKKQRKDRVLAGLRYLSRQEQRSYSHEEIGNVCGIAKESVLEIEQKAMEKLKGLLEHGLSR